MHALEQPQPPAEENLAVGRRQRRRRARWFGRVARRRVWLNEECAEGVVDVADEHVIPAVVGGERGGIGAGSSTRTSTPRGPRLVPTPLVPPLLVLAVPQALPAPPVPPPHHTTATCISSRSSVFAPAPLAVQLLYAVLYYSLYTLLYYYTMLAPVC